MVMSGTENVRYGEGDDVRYGEAWYAESGARMSGSRWRVQSSLDVKSSGHELSVWRLVQTVGCAMQGMDSEQQQQHRLTHWTGQ